MATLQKLMALLNKEGLLNQRAEIIAEWTNGRTCSARELTPQEIDEMCAVLTAPHTGDLDKKRKRLIAAIFGLHNKMNKKVSIDYVKGIACVAAKAKHFNEIPPARLVSLYNYFTNAQKDLVFVGKMVEGFINEQKNYN